MTQKTGMTANIDFSELESALQSASSDQDLFRAIVNTPFRFKVALAEMSLGIIVLLLVNKEAGTIDRIAISDNELAHRTKYRSIKKFEHIRIPLGHPKNVIAQAIETNSLTGTADWRYLFVPELSAQDARFNQAEGGIGYSAVMPMVGARDGAAMIFSYYQVPQKIADTQQDFMARYAELVERYLNRADAA